VAIEHTAALFYSWSIRYIVNRAPVTARYKKYGKVVPLQIPSRHWEHISMDFITDLPNVKGYNQCWVIVDRFTKMAHFIPLKNRKAK